MKKISNILIVSALVLSSCGKKTEETKPIRKDVTETVFAAGTLEADGTYSLTAQMDGYLDAISFKEGDLVQKGKVLAVISNPENGFNAENANALYDIAIRNTQSIAPLLTQAQNSVENARQKMQQDQVQEQRYKRLLESNSVARNEYEAALLAFQTSKTNYENALQNYKKIQQDAEQQTITQKTQKQINETILSKNIIRCVVNGKVYEKKKQVGDYVKRGDVIAVIGDAHFIYAKVNIDEGNIDKVKLGQVAVIQLNTQKTKSYQAEVWQILPSFDESSQSFVCKLRFKDPLAFSIVKTQLQSNITVGIQKNALLIPRNFLDFGGNVMIKGQKEPLHVRTQFVSNEWVQVLGGINENTVLVTENIAANKMETSEVGSQMR